MREHKTVKEKVDYLNDKLGTDYFLVFMGEECIDFYYKYISEGWDLIDVDEYANLNTLFGYDIGSRNAAKISGRLWEKDIEAMELDIDDKSKEDVIEVCKELKLNLDFSKWRTKEILAYEYY